MIQLITLIQRMNYKLIIRKLINITVADHVIRIDHMKISVIVATCRTSYSSLPAQTQRPSHWHHIVVQRIEPKHHDQQTFPCLGYIQKPTHLQHDHQVSGELEIHSNNPPSHGTYQVEAPQPVYWCRCPRKIEVHLTEGIEIKGTHISFHLQFTN